jgi:drug/metabolite transporter (DMT)-like permease
MHLKYRKLALVYLGIFFAMIFWSLSFIWYKRAYVFFGPMTTIFLRLLISAIILLIIAKVSNSLKINKKDFKLFMLAALFEPFLYFMGESFGLKMVSSVTAAVIVSTIPIFSPIIISFFYPEKLSILNIIGIVVSFLGVGLVIINDTLRFKASIPGILLMFLAVFAAIGYAIALKHLVPIYKPITIIAVQNSIGAILFAPFFAIFEWKWFLTGLSSNAMIPLINLAVFASSIAFILFAYGVSVIGVSKANTFTNLIPVITSIFSYYMLSEKFTTIKIIGIIIVVGGLFLSQVNPLIYKKVYNLSFRHIFDANKKY